MDKTRDCFPQLPNDYSNWSSAVIYFQERDEEISAFLFDSDNGAMYTVYHFARPKYLYGRVGYTAGGMALFFVGFGKFDEQEGIYKESREIICYHVPTRQHISTNYLNTPKPAPFVFFIHSYLYVLSSLLEQSSTHFEMLPFDWRPPELSRFVNLPLLEWEMLPEPSFAEHDHWACHHSYIIDWGAMDVDDGSPAPMFYVRLIRHTDVSCKAELYGYDALRSCSWQKYSLSELSPRRRNLLIASWTNDSVIVGNFLYTFRMFQYPEELRAILVIRDLKHDIKVDSNDVEADFVDTIHKDSDPPVAGIQEVNISNMVAPEVLHDLYAAGSLGYLGERDSGSRFFLVVSYNCKLCRGDKHVYPCTFDVDNQATVVSVCSLSGNHIDIGPGPLSCHKLYSC